MMGSALERIAWLLAIPHLKDQRDEKLAHHASRWVIRTALLASAHWKVNDLDSWYTWVSKGRAFDSE